MAEEVDALLLSSGSAFVVHAGGQSCIWVWAAAEQEVPEAVEADVDRNARYICTGAYGRAYL